MAHVFYPLRVCELIKTTADCTLVGFDVPEEQQNVFSFQAGQHLTLRALLDGVEVRRTYSLCTSPSEKRWQVAVKKIESGRFSHFVNAELKVGDILEAAPPAGNFFVATDPAAARQYAAFAAGSGITPILSMMKWHLESEPLCRFSLFYTNPDASSIILREEIEGLKNRYLDRLEVYYFLTREERDIGLFNGRMDTEKLGQITTWLLDAGKTDHVFLCGPEEMIFMVRDFFRQKGLSDHQIHFELFFSAAGQKRAERKSPPEGLAAANSSEVLLIEGGKTLRFTMSRGGDSILDAALRKNANLPYACKGGVCCTCKARLLEGEVEMEFNYALEKEQLDAGYILTCQASPRTPKIVVDFDQ
jgi:ring-1,2-phenylacetyl-CoA epoxidase subunit PaaE